MGLPFAEMREILGGTCWVVLGKSGVLDLVNPSRQLNMYIERSCMHLDTLVWNSRMRSGLDEFGSHWRTDSAYRHDTGWDHEGNDNRKGWREKRKKERDSMTEFWGTASFRAQGHEEKKQSRGQRKSHQREREKNTQESWCPGSQEKKCS